nr:immunoglobulin light chain junction region [Macaca mulatta]
CSTWDSSLSTWLF